MKAFLILGVTTTIVSKQKKNVSFDDEIVSDGRCVNLKRFNFPILISEMLHSHVHELVWE